MPRKRNWVWSGKSWLFTERGLGFQTRISKRDPNSGLSGLESSVFFNPLWLHRSTEQSHCGSVVLVVAELRHCFAIRINMNVKTAEQNEKQTVKLAMATMTLCNTVFMLMLLAALSTCHGNAFGAWSGKQRQRKKSWLFTERGLGFQTAGSGTRTRNFRVSSPALWPLDQAA